MKAKLLFLVAAFTLTISNINAQKRLSYVKTNDTVIYTKHLIVGINNIRVATANGALYKINKNDITSYSKNGSIFDKLTIYKDTVPTNKKAFYRLIGYHNGFKLYQSNSSIKDESGEYRPTQLIVFKDNKLHLYVNNQNIKTVAQIFHINFIY
jgi:hypothetical protein